MGEGGWRGCKAPVAVAADISAKELLETAVKSKGPETAVKSKGLETAVVAAAVAVDESAVKSKGLETAVVASASRPSKLGESGEALMLISDRLYI